MNDVGLGYRGNPHLKRKGTEIQYSPEMIQEYLKCANDPIYFSEKYIQIVHVDHGLIPIQMYDYQKEIMDAITNHRRVVVNTSRQAGKALSLDTPIPTPNGWTTMGELKVGDKIFGSDGQETTVTFATSEMENHRVYEITFDNGETVKSDAEHLWTFETFGKKYTENTDFLIEILQKAKKQGQGVRIACPKPVNYSKKSLIIEPYLLGLWLGDGNSYDSRITCDITDYEHYKNKLASLGYEVSEFRIDKRSDRTGNFNIKNLFAKLREMGILKNKNIPHEYLYSSVEQRIQLLQGLMDSDGYSGKRGSCEFYQKSEKIVDLVRQLISSLGIKVRKKSREISGQTYYTLVFSTKKFDVFTLERKLERQRCCKDNTINNHFYVKDIVEIVSEKVRCIQVDNKDHLFLCSKSFIPTHNTTTAVAVILHYVLFNEHKTVALLANKGDAAREILDRIQIAFEALPKWLQQGVVEWNKGSAELENGSKIFAGATSSSAIRGRSVSFLYIDETAFVEGWDEFFASVFPTISSGKTTKILLTSTPKGLNHFYKTCEGAKEIPIPDDPSIDPGKIGKNGYIYVEVPWQRVPGRDEAWKKETLASMDFDLQKFAQEFECEFQGSSGTLIDGSTLKNLVIKAPLAENDGISVYEKAIEDHTYVCVCDVSRGKGLDYSTFQVVDVTSMPYKVVCSYRDNMVTPIDFADYVFRTIKTYNDAYTLVEVNDIGEQVSDILHYEFEVETLLHTESAGRSGKKITGGFSGKNQDKGIRTTKSVKTIGCNMLKMMVEQDQLLINDFHTINELSTFSRKGVSYEAESGCNDDMVMCLVLFGWLTDQPFFREITDINTMARLKERNEVEMEQSVLPLGFNINDEFEEEEIPERIANQWMPYLNY